MNQAITPNDVVVDETNQRGVEHNSKVFHSTLVENGFEKVVCRPISQFTLILHTRTLSNEETQEFEAWASQEPSITKLGEDIDGTFYKVTI